METLTNGRIVTIQSDPMHVFSEHHWRGASVWMFYCVISVKNLLQDLGIFNIFV